MAPGYVIQRRMFSHLLREQLGTPVVPMPDIPFAGGALGYWSYDLARRFHHIPEIAQDAEHLPEMAVGIYDWAIVIDHHELSARLVSRQRYAETAQVLPQILERAQGISPVEQQRDQSTFSVTEKLLPISARQRIETHSMQFINICTKAIVTRSTSRNVTRRTHRAMLMRHILNCGA